MGANFLSVVNSFWSAIAGSGSGNERVGGLIDTIAGNALLLIPIAGVFVGLTIRYTKSLMGTRRRR